MEAPSTALMTEEVDKKITQLVHSSKDIHFDLLYVNKMADKRGFVVDNGVCVQEILLDIYATSLRDGSEYEPELILPLPTALEVDSHHLLTPFPVTVEALALSPNFNCKDLLIQILDQIGFADSNELRVW